MSLKEMLREIRHDLRGMLMQWLLLQALRVAPPGGAKGDLAATLKGFFERECLRLKEAGK
jgi:hypothetical protein